MPEYRILRMGKDENGADRIGAVSAKRGLLAELRLDYEAESVSLSYLWVKERERRKGIGSDLLQSVLDIVALRDSFTPLQCSFVQGDTLPLEYFFENQPNFSLIHDSHIFRISPKARKKSEFWKKLIRHVGKVDYFFEQDKLVRTMFLKKLEEKGFSGFVDQDDSLYEEPLCLAVVKDGEIKAAVLFKKHEKDELELSFAYADDDSKIRLPGLLAAAAESIDHDYSESNLWFCAVNAESHALADHLLEGDDQKLIVKETVCRACWLGWSIKEVKDIYSIAGKTA